MYTATNFRTKKELKIALEAKGSLDVFQPGLGTVPENGVVYLEGPHYPEPHKWYATGVMKDGMLVKIK